MSHPAPPELTVRAVVLAIILGVILAAANAYLGLFAGMTIASAIPAAVVSMAAQTDGRRSYTRKQYCCDGSVRWHRYRNRRDFHNAGTDHSRLLG